MQVTFIRKDVRWPRDPVADRVVDVQSHPNRNAILAAVPNATHMAGPLVLTEAEASAVRGALAAAETAPADPGQISKRLGEALKTRSRNIGIE